MKTYKNWLAGTLLAGILIVSPAALMAQDQDNGPDQADAQNQDQSQDPPSRVARLNNSNGSISFQPGGEGDWVQAVSNRPLTTGDNLWADQNSRAELHVGSTALRLGAETSLTFLDLDDQTTQLKLSQGSLIVRVRHLDDGENFEVDTPNLAFMIQRTGEYRIDVNADGNETDTTVWHGRGEVTGGGASYTVVAGQYARFSGTDQLDHEIAQIPTSDDLDNWAFARDEREDHSESANYISTEMTGYEDLDDNGSWHYVADYGPVWTPRAVAADWAPYRYGHWAWVEPWGWTWVEDEPWGFAPFHYGRWAYVSSSWCWVPGPVVVRPVYAPALVAFVGGGGFSIGVGIGGGVGVGWFPLAPREVYVPWYRTSPRYVTNVNVTNTRVNVTQVTNVYNSYHSTNVTRVTYVNQHINNGVTVVSHDTFVNARPVRQNVVRVDQRQIEQAQVVRVAPVQPVRASVVGAGASVRFRPPAAIENRRVVATHMPTAPRQSFAQRQTANVRTERPTTPQPVGQAPNPGRNNSVQPNQGRPQTPGTNGETRNEMERQPGNANAGNIPRPRNNRRGDSPQDNAGPLTQQPQAPQSVNPRNVPRPQQPVQNRESGVQNDRQVNENSRATQPQATQPMNPRNVPRPQQPMQNREPGVQNERQVNDNSRVMQPQHPLVRQAPPPQDRPEQQRGEEQKFGNWQQQRQAAQQREAPRPQERAQQPPPRSQPEKAPPPPHEDRKK